MATNSAVRPLRLRTSDAVSLEAELTVPTTPNAAVVLAHPHPLHGGSMQSLVTSELFRTLPEASCAVIRFNFRGVGASEGTHGDAIAEQLDIVAAIDTITSAAPDVPVVVSGWSFGGDTSLAVVDPRIDGWFAVAPTLRILPLDAYLAGADPRPKFLAIPEHDEFNPPGPAREKTDTWKNTELRVISGGDHYLVGRTGVVTDWLTTFVDGLSRSSAPF